MSFARLRRRAAASVLVLGWALAAPAFAQTWAYTVNNPNNSPGQNGLLVQNAWGSNASTVLQAGNNQGLGPNGGNFFWVDGGGGTHTGGDLAVSGNASLNATTLTHGLVWSDSSNGISNLMSGCGTGGWNNGCDYAYGASTSNQMMQVGSDGGNPYNYYGTHNFTGFAMYNTTTHTAFPYPASFTGSVSGNILTVTSTPTYQLVVGGAITDFQSPPFGYIVTQLSGTPGGVGTYQLSGSYTASSRTFYQWSNSANNGSEYMVLLNQRVKTGAEVAAGISPHGQGVGIGVNQDVFPTGGSHWGMAISQNLRGGWAGSNAQQSWGIELDKINGSGHDCTAGSPVCFSTGLWINQGGPNRNTIGIYISPNSVPAGSWANDMGISCTDGGSSHIAHHACYQSAAGAADYQFSSEFSSSTYANYNDQGTAPIGYQAAGTYSTAAFSSNWAATSVSLLMASGQKVCFTPSTTNYCIYFDGTQLVRTDGSGAPHPLQ